MAKKAKKAKVATSGGKSGGKGKLIIIIAVALVVVLGGAGAGLYFTGIIGGTADTDPQQEAEMQLGAPVFQEYEEMAVDLRTGECRAPFLRFVMVVQIGEADKGQLSTYDLRIRDKVVNHIRSYERQDLVGEEGANRIRTDLVAVINNVIHPAQVHAVLFKQFVLN